MRNSTAAICVLSLVLGGTLFPSLAGARAARPSPVIQLVEVEPGVSLEVLDWGGTGRAVVLLGGDGRTAHDFESFGPALSANGYHAVAITRRGFGASSKPAGGYSADRLGDDVLAVIDALGLKQPIVAGHSLGGEELSSIGSRHPERVGGLVYLDGAYGYAFYDETDRDSAEKINRNEVASGLRRLTEAAEAGNAEEAHRLLTRLLGTDLPALKQSLEGIQARIPATSAQPASGYMMRLAPGVDRMVFEGLQRYTSVRAPILAIFALKGQKDPAVLGDWQTGRRHELVALKRAAPQARVVILPDASHDVFRSNEADVLRELKTFIASLTSTPAATMR